METDVPDLYFAALRLFCKKKSEYHFLAKELYEDIIDVGPKEVLDTLVFESEEDDLSTSCSII